MSKAAAVSWDILCGLIAEALAEPVKSYNLPSVCMRLGIQDAIAEEDTTEAHRSKRSYVKSYLAVKSLPELEALGVAVNCEYPNDALADVLSEIKFSGQKVSELVRRDVLKVLNRVPELFGERDLFDVLDGIFGHGLVADNVFVGRDRNSLREQILQHWIRNPEDWSAEQLLIECGALTCSQVRFFRLLEEVTHPTSRRDEEQAKLANLLAVTLARSGFTLQVTDSDSGYPIYGVVGMRAHVAGTMKNLIFASIGEKPDLVFRDAVNNDVEIVRNADSVLVYDRMLPPSGALLWKDIQTWWAESNRVPTDTAKSQLYKRLKHSVRLARSPGEYAVFLAYYERYPALLGDRLPALIPQVYLHYDPYTKRQRGDEQFLARQRMDFLLMLENGIRIVIEIDGRHHYSYPERVDTDRAIADPQRYAEMTAEDRRLRLRGYEVFRFGGAEFRDVEMRDGVPWSIGPLSRQLVDEFFDRLLVKYGVMKSQ